jgi:uncharacterized membrane protein
MLEISRYFLAFMMIAGGILHFVKPRFYMKIMPDYLSSHFLLVILSGIAEVICGILLLFPYTQNWGSYLTIALLIAVFPANIEMSRKFFIGKKKGFWLTIVRLPLQILLIWWAFQLIK